MTDSRDSNAVTKGVLHEFVWPHDGASDVRLTGDFLGWGNGLPMSKDAARNVFFLGLRLPPGVPQHYKFVVDGEWIHDPTQPFEVDEFHNMNNVVTVGIATSTGLAGAFSHPHSADAPASPHRLSSSDSLLPRPTDSEVAGFSPGAALPIRIAAPALGYIGAGVAREYREEWGIKVDVSNTSNRSMPRSVSSGDVAGMHQSNSARFSSGRHHFNLLSHRRQGSITPKAQGGAGASSFDTGLAARISVTPGAAPLSGGWTTNNYSSGSRDPPQLQPPRAPLPRHPLGAPQQQLPEEERDPFRRRVSTVAETQSSTDEDSPPPHSRSTGAAPGGLYRDDDAHAEDGGDVGNGGALDEGGLPLTDEGTEAFSGGGTAPAAPGSPNMTALHHLLWAQAAGSPRHHQQQQARSAASADVSLSLTPVPDGVGTVMMAGADGMTVAVSARMAELRSGAADGGALGAPHAGGRAGLAKVDLPKTANTVTYNVVHGSGAAAISSASLFNLSLVKTQSEGLPRTHRAEQQSTSAAAAGPSSLLLPPSLHRTGSASAPVLAEGQHPRASTPLPPAGHHALLAGAPGPISKSASGSAISQHGRVGATPPSPKLGVDAATVGVPVSIPIKMGAHRGAPGGGSHSSGHRHNAITSVQASLRKEGKLVLAMVGLPARGKTFMARRLKRHLHWLGYKTEIYNVGNYRRRILGATQPAEFFDPLNTAGEQARREMASVAFEEMVEAMASDTIDIAIFDATNTTIERRRWLRDALLQREVSNNMQFQLVFIESICTDESIIRANVRETKLKSPDYKDLPEAQAVTDFLARIGHYQTVYQPLTDAMEADVPYIKLIDVGRQIIANRINGYLNSRIMFFLSNLHITPRPIWLTRHGESEYNVQGRIGGDSQLSPRGYAYSLRLASFINANYPIGQSELVVWTSSLKRTQMTAAPIKRDIVQWKALDEIDAGICDGMTYEAIAATMPDEYASRGQNKFTYRYPRGESYQDIVHRLEPVIIELMRQKDPVLIVSHQATLRVLYAYLTDKDPDTCPDLLLPLHTVIQLTPFAYGCTELRHELL